MRQITLSLSLLLATYIFGQATTTLSVTGSKELIKRDALIAPYVVKARKKLNWFYKAYNKKNIKDAKYYAVIRLYDSDGKYDQIFAELKSWDGNRLTGRITNTPKTVTQYRKDQVLEFKEEVILDWLIVYPNGKEKGNYIGNFLKQQQ